ncbi:MAG: type II toxin-antitoxin system Phd/YefM family antitoxin [Chloroflexota bacterium]
MSLTKVKSGEARAKWRDILDQVFAGKGDVIIERNGKQVAVLISAAAYEQFREKRDGIRAVRESSAPYKTLKPGEAIIDAEAGTATVSLDWYNEILARRESLFDVIREIQENAPDLPEEEVQEIVEAAIRKVRAENAARSS